MIRTVLLSGPGVVAFLVVVFAGTIAVLRSLAIDEQAPHVGEDTRQRLVEARRREDAEYVSEAQRRRAVGAVERERLLSDGCYVCRELGWQDCGLCGPVDAA